MQLTKAAQYVRTLADTENRAEFDASWWLSLRQRIATELARTSSFDLCPWKPYHRCLLTQWIFMASFIEIPPLIRDTASREIKVNGRTDLQGDGYQKA